MNRTVQYNGVQYDRVRVLGKGSFGTAIVYRRLTDCSLVVLKEIDLHRFRGESERRLAINEARIMSTLTHANIIKYYNAYTTDSRLVIEMEYASIGTLQSYLLLQSHPLGEQEVVVIFRQIASGLAYLHSKNIVHLDLKMANIFVTGEGFVKIGDFGIAQYMQHYDDTNQLTKQRDSISSSQQLGTLAYSSPERCLGEPTDFKSDIWSLGCILYELLTLRQTFPSNSLAELVSDILRVNYRPIERPIAPALNNAIVTMLDRNPNNRPEARKLLDLCNQLLRARLDQSPVRQIAFIRSQQFVEQSNRTKPQRHHYHDHYRPLEISTEAFLLDAIRQETINQISCPHSIVYQVRLDTRNIQVERVNLPINKRIKSMSKGKSHYLLITYDNVVYGWGSRNCGQLGACSLNVSSAANYKLVPFCATKSSQQAGLVKSQPLTPMDSIRSTVSKSTGARNMIDPTAKTTQMQSQYDLRHQTISRDISCESTKSLHTMENAQSARAQSSTTTTSSKLTRQLVMDLLEKAKPATKPFVINELHNRKIVQLVAGNDFSVFLSRTGIVMTCGDGSTGCLGHGDFVSCFTPCMVDSLLSYDVIAIACGPKHVVAVCGDGRVFAWGKKSHGRLGIDGGGPSNSSTESSSHYEVISNGCYHPSGMSPVRSNSRNNDERRRDGKGHASSAGSNKRVPQQADRYIARPQLVQFPSCVAIKQAFCGNRCTIFIDSEGRCWACGENRSNRLGLDVKRRLRRTIVIDTCWTPTEITALGKHTIRSCSIGKNHTSFLTDEGKLIIFGQDTDYDYRLRSNIVGDRESHRRISFELHTNIQRSTNPMPLKSDAQRISYTPKAIDLMKNSEDLQFIDKTQHHRSMIRSLLSHNQLQGHKLGKEQFRLNNTDQQQDLPKLRATKFEQKQIDSYMKKSRSSRKMPFEYVIGMSATSKFTLALTNDNRIYFWGTRSYFRSDKCSCSPEKSAQKCRNYAKLKTDKHRPQLVPDDLDECFIKIGPTNSSLMSSIQKLGSDQPIIHAQDPHLVADSLANLWILDYEPAENNIESSPSSDSSATSSYSCSCSCSSQCPYDSDCPIYDEIDDNEDGQSDPTSLVNINHSRSSNCIEHDAILKPHPIVSLYVPPMLNQNGCSLQIVNLYCFDEDRFYLILDTTIQMSHGPIAKYRSSSANRNRIIRSSQLPTGSGGLGTALRSMERQMESQSRVGTHPSGEESNRNNDPIREEELKMAADTDANQVSASNMSLRFDQGLNDDANRGNLEDGELPGRNCGSIFAIDLERQDSCAGWVAAAERHSNSNIDTNNNALTEISSTTQTNPSTTMPSSQFRFSIEEPRSISTLVGGHMLVMDSGSKPFVTLNFNQAEEPYAINEDDCLPQPCNGHLMPNARPRDRSRDNKSESTTFNDNDDITSMPSWVKAEFMQQNCVEIAFSGNELSTSPNSMGVTNYTEKEDGNNLTEFEQVQELPEANQGGRCKQRGVEERLNETGSIASDQTLACNNVQQTNRLSLQGSMQSSSMVSTIIDNDDVHRLNPLSQTPQSTLSRSRSQPEIRPKQDDALQLRNENGRCLSIVAEKIALDEIAIGSANLLECGVYKAADATNPYLSQMMQFRGSPKIGSGYDFDQGMITSTEHTEVDYDNVNSSLCFRSCRELDDMEQCKPTAARRMTVWANGTGQMNTNEQDLFRRSVDVEYFAKTSKYQPESCWIQRSESYQQSLHGRKKKDFPAMSSSVTCLKRSLLKLFC